MTDNRVAVVRLDGRAIGPPLCDHATTSDAIAVAPTVPALYVGRYYDGTITAYNQTSGDRLWRTGGVRHISTVHIAAAKRVVGRQLDGTCVDLDAVSGAVLVRQGRVRQVFCDSLRPLRALNRGPSRSAALGLEVYGEDLETPLFVERRRDDDLASVEFGSDYLVYGSHTRLALRCLSLRGEERWVYTHGDRWQYPCVSCVDDHTVYALAHHIDGTVPSYGLLIDARSGTLLRAREYKTSEKSFVPIAGGKIIADAHGYRTLPDMEWHPVAYAI